MMTEEQIQNVISDFNDSGLTCRVIFRFPFPRFEISHRMETYHLYFYRPTNLWNLEYRNHESLGIFYSRENIVDRCLKLIGCLDEISNNNPR